MSPRSGWTHDKRHGVWLSPDGQFVADRKNTLRWSLWRLPEDGRITGAKVISDWHRSLSCAIEYAAGLEER